MDSRNNFNAQETNPRNMNLGYAAHINSSASNQNQNLKKSDSLKDRILGLFKRGRSKTEDSTGFINRQMPAYWHGK